MNAFLMSITVSLLSNWLWAYFFPKMADFLGDNPELRPFVLSDVRLTGTRIGSGAYGSVEEVAIPVGAAAKKIHDIFQDRSEIPEDEILRVN